MDEARPPDPLVDRRRDPGEEIGRVVVGAGPVPHRVEGVEDGEFPGHGDHQRRADDGRRRPGLGEAQGHLPAERRPPMPGGHDAAGDEQEDEVVQVGEEGDADHRPEDQRSPAGPGDGGCPPDNGGGSRLGHGFVEEQQGQDPERQQLQVAQVVVGGVDEAIGGERERRSGHERRRPVAGDVLGQQVGAQPRPGEDADQRHVGVEGRVGPDGEEDVAGVERVVAVDEGVGDLPQVPQVGGAVAAVGQDPGAEVADHRPEADRR